jgi:hypothetical protein
MAASRQVGRLSGWVVFASVMMGLAGAFSVIDGLVAILVNEVYVVTEEGILAFDFTAWGVIHLILGIVVFVAAFVVLTGQLWARVLGVAVAFLSALGQLAFITALPLWSIVIIGIDVLVIYGLVVHGEEVETA